MLYDVDIFNDRKINENEDFKNLNRFYIFLI